VPNVCVIGSANVDYAVSLPRLPSPGETVSGGTLLVNLGGKGANQAMAARRLGGEVRMIGCVGTDTDGRRIRTALGEAGIGIEGLVETSLSATGIALILVDAEGQNQIAVAPGANHRLTVELTQQRDAGIDRLAGSVGALEHHGAGAAIAFGAALLGALEAAMIAQPVEQGRHRRGGVELHRLVVQDKTDTVRHANDCDRGVLCAQVARGIASLHAA